MIGQEELLAEFIDEALQHFQTIEPDLLELETEADRIDEETINRLFRGMHSIKGAAGFFGLKNITELGHMMENLLSLVREKRLLISSDLVDALLAGVDALRSMVEDVGNSDNFDISEIMERLQNQFGDTDRSTKTITLSEKTADGKPGRTFEVPEDQVRRLVKSGNEVYSVEVYLNKDISEKKKTPFDFINNITSVGEFIKISFSFDKITGLDNCLDNELSVVFLFSTIMEKNLVHLALEIPEEQVIEVDLDNYKQQFRSRIVRSETKNPVKNPDTVEPSTEESKPSTTVRRQIESEEKIRVGVTILNDLMNLAGELVLGRNQLMQIASPLARDVQGLNPVLQHVSRITTELQSKIMLMRLQPVSILFGKFQRVVRELAKKLGKEIRLLTYGEDVELDKTIIEALSDPLTHLIRNSCDHAIELPDDRQEMGKPRLGTVELKAFHQAGQVYLEVIDDGKGIDTDIIGQKAVEKKLVTSEELKEMSDKEKLRLILRPGFSTATEVTDLSGRGVGMDVVNSNISQLGGSLEIETELGGGTKFTLMLPLTLAIVSGLVIRSDGQYFIVPETNIEELVRIKPVERDRRISIIHDAKVLRLREKLLPLINLKDILKLAPEESDAAPDDDQRPVRILVVKNGNSIIGIEVDSMDDFEEIVVKPLPRYLQTMKYYSGVSIMGKGNVALILDVAGIVAKAHLTMLEEKLEKMATKKTVESKTEEQQTMLLFDNKTDERFALPLELITRIERINAAAIERVKDKYYIQYQGEELRLIFLEDYLPITRPERDPKEMLRVIIPKQMTHQVGLVVGDVHGTIRETIHLDTKNIVAPGLFGSAVLSGRITLLPDLYKLIEIATPEWLTDDEDAKSENRKKQILLVDDTAFFRMIESDYLHSAGYAVIVAENGRQALDLIESQKVDAVILDIMMPVMDGWEVIKAIRQDKRFKNLPVMAVTSLREEQFKEKGFDAGFTEWESKLNKELLLAKLESMLAAVSVADETVD